MRLPLVVVMASVAGKFPLCTYATTLTLQPSYANGTNTTAGQSGSSGSGAPSGSGGSSSSGSGGNSGSSSGSQQK
ncbi:hypothetical protein CCMA1212_001394 [Trichoderma ghanense]|uniref:Uncharacterized protein n=1 Tax=Trichoderma ghanense TaxID=65468 RepID=A0ABY2HHZ2_9HYPO